MAAWFPLCSLLVAACAVGADAAMTVTPQQLEEALNDAIVHLPLAEATMACMYRQEVWDRLMNGTDPAPESPLAQVMNDTGDDEAKSASNGEGEQPRTRQQLEEALDGAIASLPLVEAARVRQHKQESLDCLMKRASPSLHGPVENMLPADDLDDLEKKFTKECGGALGWVAADIGFAMYGAVGLNKYNKKYVAKKIARQMGKKTLHGMRLHMREWKEATKILDKAWIMVNVARKVGIPTFFIGAKAAMKSLHLSVFDVAKFTVVITAQLTAWFASAGAALVGEMVIFLTQIATFMKDVRKAFKICWPDLCPGGIGGGC